MTRSPVGVIGLGAMGDQIAHHLLTAGFKVTGFDVRTEAMRALEREGLLPAYSAAGVARVCNIVITSLPTTASMLTSATGPGGLVEGAHPELVLIETSTFDLAFKQQLNLTLGSVGICVLDCPISGTSGQLAERDVVVYGSGETTTLAAVGPVLSAFSRTWLDLGAFGNGTLMKLVSNLLVTVHTVAAAEALGAAERLGLDRAMALAALRSGGGTSRMLEVRGPLMVGAGYQPAFARLADFIKDIRLISALEEQASFPAPLFDACVTLYESALAEGWGHLDHAVVAELFRGDV